MDFKYIKDLAKEFKLSENDCYNILLSHGNKIHIKILHEIDNNIIIPISLYDSVISTIESINNSLTDYQYIKNNASETIPFKTGGYVYYLFNDFDMVYIGQSTAIAGRINQHISDGKDFNRVYLELVDKKDLLIKEKFYIHRDMPKLNISVMDNKEYLKEILRLTDHH